MPTNSPTTRQTRRRLPLALAFLTLLGAVVLAPLPSFAATPVSRIDDVALTLTPADTGAGAGASARSGLSTPTTAPPVAAAADPVTPEGRTTLTKQAGRLTTSTSGIAPFSLIGLSIRTPEASTALIRVHNAAGWGEWQPVELDSADAPDAGSAEAVRAEAVTRGIPVSAPIWVGPSDGYEVNAPAGSTDASVHLAREQVKRTRVDGNQAGAVTAPDLGRPAIMARSAWQARRPVQAPALNPTLRLAVVHHSVTANAYAPADVPGILRSIQAYHIDSRGWNDIAYNFAVDKYGTVWEARGGGVTNAVEGGHALGGNFESTGVVTLGDFTSFAPPQVMVNAIGSLIGWKLYIHGSDPSATVQYKLGPGTKYPNGANLKLPTIIGHRDIGATGCPGDLLYAHLDEIRTIARTTYANLRGSPGLWPDVVTGTNADGRLEQFAVGNDQRIWHAWQNFDGSWSVWSPLSGRVSGRLAVGRNADGRLEVFAAGVPNGLWHVWQVAPNGGWSGGSDLGGNWSTTVGVAVATNTDGRQEVFVVGDHYGIWHIAQTTRNGNWGAFGALGGSLPSNASIVAGSNTDGRLEVFTIGDAGDLIHAWQVAPNSGWSGVVSLGGSLAGGLSIIRNADGRLEIFGRAASGGLVHLWQGRPNGGWSGFVGLGGSPAVDAGTAVAVNADGRLEIFTTGTDGSVWHGWQTAVNGSWSGVWSLGGRGAGTPGAARGSDGRLRVVAIDPTAPTRAQISTQLTQNGGWSAWGFIG